MLNVTGAVYKYACNHCFIGSVDSARFKIKEVSVPKLFYFLFVAKIIIENKRMKI